jgi:MFS family permease
MTMSQGKLGNGAAGDTSSVRPLRLEAGPANEVGAPDVLRPANDVGDEARVWRTGPLGLPRVYWVLWGGMLVNRLGGMVFMLLGIYLTRERGLPAELAGLVISLNAAGGLVGGPVGGALADRFGRRATLLAGTLLSGALMLALGLARSTGGIVAVAPLLGFFTGLCPAPLQASVADVVAPAHRARAYGLLYWAINLGFAGASALGGLLADRHFPLLFVLDALTTFAYGAVVLFGVPETRPGVVATNAPAARRGLAPFRDRRFLGFVLVQGLLLLAFAQVILALPLDMRAHGLGTQQIGWLLGLNGVYIVIAQPIALRTLRRFDHVRWLVAGAVLVGLGLGATALAHGPAGYALAALVWTLGEIGFSTAAPALVAELAPADRRGAYQGTYQLAWGVSSTFAPALGSIVLARLGSTALWVGCLGVSLLAAALHLRVTGQRRIAPGAGLGSPPCSS